MDLFPAICSRVHFTTQEGKNMLNKRIAGFAAGTALAASAVMVPQVSAQPTTINDQAGVYQDAYWWNGPGQSGNIVSVQVFIPNGMALLTPDQYGDDNQSHNKCYIQNSSGDESGLKHDILTPVQGHPGYYTVDSACLSGEYTPPGDRSGGP